jgi:hypothetical protein
MVRALLAGAKTQTRRALRQPAGAERNRFGQPGDLLWVRETFFAFGRWTTRFNHAKQRDEWVFIDMTLACGRAWHYAADEAPGFAAQGRREAGAAPCWHKRTALFMPRAASRILLRIAEVRIERLQDIGVADALAEGIAPGTAADPVQAYRGIWEGINGAGSWEANPLVWVVAFSQIPLASL